MRRLGFLVVVLACIVVGGCSLSRAETREWREIAQRLEQYNKQAASIIRDALAGNIRAEEAAKSLDLLFQSKDGDLDRRVELAEARARNFWGAVAAGLTLLGSAASWLATRYSWAKPFAAVVKSVQAGKGQLDDAAKAKFSLAVHDSQKRVPGLETLIRTVKAAFGTKA
jgi:hypothetical protein